MDLLGNDAFQETHGEMDGSKKSTISNSWRLDDFDELRKRHRRTCFHTTPINCSGHALIRE